MVYEFWQIAAAILGSIAASLVIDQRFFSSIDQSLTLKKISSLRVSIRHMRLAFLGQQGGAFRLFIVTIIFTVFFYCTNLLIFFIIGDQKFSQVFKSFEITQDLIFIFIATVLASYFSFMQSLLFIHYIDITSSRVGKIYLVIADFLLSALYFSFIMAILLAMFSLLFDQYERYTAEFTVIEECRGTTCGMSIKSMIKPLNVFMDIGPFLGEDLENMNTVIDDVVASRIKLVDRVFFDVDGYPLKQRSGSLEIDVDHRYRNDFIQRFAYFFKLQAVEIFRYFESNFTHYSFIDPRFSRYNVKGFDLDNIHLRIFDDDERIQNAIYMISRNIIEPEVGMLPEYTLYLDDALEMMRFDWSMNPVFRQHFDPYEIRLRFEMSNIFYFIHQALSLQLRDTSTNYQSAPGRWRVMTTPYGEIAQDSLPITTSLISSLSIISFTALFYLLIQVGFILKVAEDGSRISKFIFRNPLTSLSIGCIFLSAMRIILIDFMNIA
ncbi:MAG: hypothetical protein AAF160_05085 [Pseudomonadota bacterium]